MTCSYQGNSEECQFFHFKRYNLLCTDFQDTINSKQDCLRLEAFTETLHKMRDWVVWQSFKIGSTTSDVK